MTLRAYRPNEPSQDEQQDWQATLLDRPANNRQSLHVAYDAPPRSKLWLLTGIFVCAAVLVTGYFVLQTRSHGGAIPLVQADTAPYKTQPDQPGGTEIPFQDKLVFNRLDPNGQPVKAEKLLPPPEEPMPAAPMPTASIQAVPSAVTRSVNAPPSVASTTVAPAPAAAPVETVAAAPVQAAPVTQPASASASLAQPQPVAAASESAAPASAPVTATVPTPPVQAVPAKPQPIAKAAPIPAVTATSAATGTVRIQLASIPDQANAQKALPTLSGKYGSALGGAKLSLVKADIPGKGTYWRVQSQPMDKAAADRICTAVKAQGGVCIAAK